jgi:myo-inositol-1(or 4)-monophosphatase
MINKIKKIIQKAADEIKKVSEINSYQKKGVGNIVTSADIKSEEVIKTSLKKEFINCQFLSEETLSKVTKENFKKTKLLFVIDPIDGTTNYAFNIPFSAISVAAYEFGKPKCGVIYDLFKKDIYEAIPGKGAFLNNKPIVRKKVNSLEKAIIGTSWAYGNTPKDLIEKWRKIIGKVATLRISGSAVLDLTMLATGQFTCYIHNSLKPYDSAAGLIILKEMNIKATNWEKESLSLFDKNIIAAPEELYEEFYKLIFK